MCAGMEFQDRLSLRNKGQKSIKNAPFCVIVKKKYDVSRLFVRIHMRNGLALGRGTRGQLKWVSLHCTFFLLLEKNFNQVCIVFKKERKKYCSLL